MKLHELKREYEVSILDGMARTLWVLTYADFAEKNGRCVACGESIHSDDDRTWVDSTDGDACPGSDDGHEPDTEFWPVAGPGGDWGAVAPETPAVAYTCATAICRRIVEIEGAAIADLFELAMTIDQGEFEWFEEEGRPSGGKDRDSKARREEREAKHEAAVEFGSGLAASSLGEGFGWGDHRKTKRGSAVFELKMPRCEFRIDDFDLVSWSVAGASWETRRHGTDSVTRNISIGRMVPKPNERYMGDEEIEVNPGDLQGYSTVAEFTANALRDEVDANTLEPSSKTYVDGVFYRGRAPAIRVEGFAQVPTGSPTIELALNGFFPAEREWVFYLVTGKIGRIDIVNGPYDGTGDFDANVLLWFGTHLFLVFGRSTNLDAAVDSAVDFIEEKGWSGLFSDDAVNEEYERLIQEACEKRGFPDPDMLSDRERDRIREISEQDMMTAGNHGHYINASEWGISGQDLSLDELRKIGTDGFHGNPDKPRHMKVEDIKRAAAPPDQKATVKVTPIPFIQRRPTSAASRSRR